MAPPSVTAQRCWAGGFRDRQTISLEQAIHKLTVHAASIYGIEGHGPLRPGFVADVTVFDPNTVEACAPEWAEDYPAGIKRLSQNSEGIRHHRRRQNCLG